MPPRSESTKPHYKGPFLFVNRKPQDVGQRTKGEAFAINSHVASRYRKWLKTKSPEEGSSATPDQSLTLRRQSVNDDGQIEDSGDSSVDVVYHYLYPHASDPRKTATLNPYSFPLDEQSFATIVCDIPTVKYFLGRLTYYLCPVGASPSMLSSIQLSFATESNKLLMENMAVHALSAVSLAASYQSSSSEAHRRTLYHLAWCLRLLNEHLQNHSVTSVALATINLVAYLHFLQNDIATCHLHSQAMHSLLPKIGGLRGLSDLTRTCIILCELERSYFSHKRMALPVSEWGFNEWDSDHVESILQDHGMSIKYQRFPKMHKEIPAELHGYLHQERELSRLYMLASKIKDTQEGDMDQLYYLSQERRWTLTATALDLYNNIQDRHQEKPVPPTEFTDYKLALCICLMIPCCRRVIVDPRHENMRNIPLSQLQAQVDLFLTIVGTSGTTETYDASRLWVLFVGSCVEFLLQSYAQQLVPWFSPRFIVLVEQLKWAIERICDEFSLYLYEDDAMGWILNDLLQSTLSREVREEVQQVMSLPQSIV